MAIKRKLLIAIVTVAVGFTGVIGSQIRIDRVKLGEVGDELLYLPNEKLLHHLTVGMDSVIADLLWIRCIQYTAKHFKGDGRYTWLNHMCNMITRLDPYFMPVYRYGGIYLTSLKADDDASLELLKRGMVKCPTAWELPYEIAMIYLISRTELPGSRAIAARYMAMAVETGKAPPFVVEVASNLQAQHDLVDVERTMWEGTLKSGDQLLRDLAARKLQELDLRDVCGKLDEAVGMYTQRLGRAPETLSDLVRNRVLVSLPEDPLGGRFFIDADGKVRNTSVLDGRVERDLKSIRLSLGAFRDKKGRWPESLEELVQERVMTSIPAHPYAGRTWSYSPETGKVE